MSPWTELTIVHHSSLDLPVSLLAHIRKIAFHDSGVSNPHVTMQALGPGLSLQQQSACTKVGIRLKPYKKIG